MVRPKRQFEPLSTDYVAVHEIGHLLAAWHCTAVHTVHRVQLTETGGRVQHDIRVGYNKYTWADLVIAVSGITAELWFYGKAHALPSQSDLTRARILAKQLVAGCDVRVAFPFKSRTLGIARMFRCALSDDERYVLDAAYAKARMIVSRTEHLYAPLLSLLHQRPELSETDLVPVLGRRVTLLTAPTFLLPQTKLDEMAPEKRVTGIWRWVRRNLLRWIAAMFGMRYRRIR